MNARTYTHMRLAPLEFLQDAVTLYRVRARNLVQQAEDSAGAARLVDALLKEQLGCGFPGQRVLIVGTGQTLREFYAFSSLGADVTGVDVDVIPLGLDVRAYLAVLKNNGPVRLLKTVGRRVLGIDAAFETALARALGVKQLNRGRLMVADAACLPLADGSMDVAYSSSVFEHLVDPRAVTREMKRVLRPGGVLRLSIHIYTAEGGCHDLRIFAGARDGIPYWAHLRPPHRHAVREACYLNRWSLAQWEALLNEELPGVSLGWEPHHAALDAVLKTELRRLRSAGELHAYEDRELLTVNLLATWKKPVIHAAA